MDIISNILPYFKKELRGFINDREIVSICYIVIEIYQEWQDILGKTG